MSEFRMTGIVYSTFKMLFMRGFASVTQQSITISIWPFHGLAVPTQVSSKWHRQSIHWKRGRKKRKIKCCARGVAKDLCAGINSRTYQLTYFFICLFVLIIRAGAQSINHYLAWVIVAWLNVVCFQCNIFLEKVIVLLATFRWRIAQCLYFSKRLIHP